MTKTALIAALLAVLTTEASAQSRVFYDVAGRNIGSATTDSRPSRTTIAAVAASSVARSRRATRPRSTTRAAAPLDDSPRRIARAHQDQDQVPAASRLHEPHAALRHARYIELGPKAP
jgi:hypothetical protein